MIFVQVLQLKGANNRCLFKTGNVQEAYVPIPTPNVAILKRSKLIEILTQCLSISRVV